MLAAEAPPVHVEPIGRSVENRPIGLYRVGDPKAPRRVLVVGCIHGDECEGRKIVRDLRTASPPPGVQLLLVLNLNPDGFAHHTRGNAHGVDLNRNSPEGRRSSLPPPFSPGPRAWSEPETRAIRAVILRERPELSIWYHQPLTLVATRSEIGRRYARLVGLRAGDLAPRPGSISRWQNARVRSGPAFVVELAPGRLSDALARKHARAVLTLARGL